MEALTRWFQLGDLVERMRGWREVAVGLLAMNSDWGRCHRLMILDMLSKRPAAQLISHKEALTLDLDFSFCCVSSECHHAPGVRKTHENTIVNMNEHSNAEGSVDNIAFLGFSRFESTQTRCRLERCSNVHGGGFWQIMVAVTSSVITGKEKNLDIKHCLIWVIVIVQVCHVCF